MKSLSGIVAPHGCVATGCITEIAQAQAVAGNVCPDVDLTVIALDRGSRG